MLQTVKPRPRRWQRPGRDYCGSPTVPPPRVPKWQNTAPLSPGGSPHRLCHVKESGADTTAHKSCVDRPVITDIFLTQHISVAAACQPEHGQSRSEGQQRENML